jgi:hypothetical protein
VAELGITKKVVIPVQVEPILVLKVALVQHLGVVMIPAPVVATPVLEVGVVLIPVLLLKPPLKP